VALLRAAKAQVAIAGRDFAAEDVQSACADVATGSS
jgi:hypothetical protein